MNLKSFSFYSIFLVLSAIVVLTIWYFLVDGILYYCSDKAPLIDFIPPFVHAGYGDYFVAPQLVVYLVWLMLITLGFLAPYYFTSKLIYEVGNPAIGTHHKPVKHKK